ncbi:regulatory subunit for Cdc7p protein kinase [Rhizoctonia solani]|uniref:Regulatory subunit for Cdc7p protein kinase n=1 Tax=Rhizoctonia solani TaxID=456999 RepID=A0A8H8SXF5_9AGAM|nr:regulatory subunit for Cdc7p protein kinase [Rhizoctonia solani]QRW21329.1 regulatory subunit for Cdc7p protein kinase [Rhizoctonia solani]
MPLSSRAASARWTTGSAAPRTTDMLPASTITAVATAPPRVPNHKRARSPDPDREETMPTSALVAVLRRLVTTKPPTPGPVNGWSATKHRQSQICKALGARIEPFFSRNATHVITSCPRPRIDALMAEAASNKENNPKKNQDVSRSPAKTSVPSTSRPKPSDAPETSALLAKAIAYGIKIWETTKLTNILESITHQSRASRSATPSAQPTLEHLLATERIHGTHERDPTARRPDYTYFPRNSYVLLVEDLTGVHATVATRDFGPKPVGGAKPGWPVCYAHPDARGPFEPPKPDRKERGRERERDPTVVSRLRRTASMSQLRGKRLVAMGDELEQEQEIEEDPDADQPGYIAASGNSVAITSNVASTTSTAVTGPTLPRVRSTLRFQALAKGASAGAGTNAMPPPRTIRKAKSTNTLAVRLPPREERKKPGYCENCRARFEDFDQHINGTKHRRFATKDSNFRELDQLLDRIQRRPIEQAEQYDEDDDSYHYGGLEDDVGDSSEDYGELLAPSLGEFDFMDRRVMTNGKAGLDSDVIVVEPGDTQEEDQDAGI